ncbi:MAG: prephenate dehydratase [Elainellaceae cyanobacterium]
MTDSLAFLGPAGTYAEAAALACAQWWQREVDTQFQLRPYGSIFQALQAAATQECNFAIVPVENSIEGSVNMTLDTLWQFDTLQVQQAWVLPISHALLSQADDIQKIEAVYSHPQALAQCQGWLQKHLPQAKLVPTRSTTEALHHLEETPTRGAIASRRAAKIYHLPVLAHPINDHPDNCTRFWLMSSQQSSSGSHSSLAFSLPSNAPGALLKPLQFFAERNINMSRIESRPTKRALGEYVFFIDIERNLSSPDIDSGLEELKKYTETLKIFGSYSIHAAT